MSRYVRLNSDAPYLFTSGLCTLLNMTAYRNFIVDFPARLAELDRRFRPIASTDELEVTYLLMKLAASFLLPYERIEGTSGARRADIQESQSIRKLLELDRRFREASYFVNITKWSYFDVDDFFCGPPGWQRVERQVDVLLVSTVLQIIRHAVAHSNLFFDGESKIEHIYLGSQRRKERERDRMTSKYHVVECTLDELNSLTDAWISNVQKLRVSPSLIWREFEEGA